MKRKQCWMNFAVVTAFTWISLASLAAIAQGDEHHFTTSDRDPDSVTHSAIAAQSCDGDVFSQSVDPKTLSVNTVQCGHVSGATQEIGLGRSFAITSNVEVCSVQFGIEDNDEVGAWPIEVRLFEGDIDGPYEALELRGTSSVSIDPNTSLEFFLATFDPPVHFSAGENLVVELFIATRRVDLGGDGGQLWLGSNALGETAPSYVRSPPCSAPNFVPYASIGASHVHIAMKVFTGSPTETVALNTAVCQTTSTLTVNIDLTGNGVDEVLGGQFFLLYDSMRLDFVSADPAAPPSPFTLEIHQFHAPGVLEYAVGVDHAGSGTSGNANMAVLTFDVLQEDCTVADLVLFGPGDNKLSDGFGQPLFPILIDLSVVILDQTPPDLTAPPDASFDCKLPDGYGLCAGNCGGFVPGPNCFCDEDCQLFDDCCPNICVACPLLVHCEPPAPNDNCDPDPAILFSDVIFSGLCPQEFTIERTWVATDHCGLSSPDHVQIIEIVDDTAPTISGVPNDIVTYSDAGVCGAFVNWTPPTAVDDCTDIADITISNTHDPGDFFPVGVTPVSYSFADECGNTASVNFNVEVLPVSQMLVDVSLQSVAPGPFMRCVEFELTDASGVITGIASETLVFTNGESAAMIEVPCGAEGDCVLARDPLHTLRSIGDLTIVGTQYVTENFVALRGGDLNDDGVVDILDFGHYLYQLDTNPNPGPDTDCDTVGPHADMVGDGVVFTADFTMIQVNYLQVDEVCQTTLKAGERRASARSQMRPQPRTSVTVRELERMGLGHLAVADLNHDGIVDEQDIVLFLAGERP